MTNPGNRSLWMVRVSLWLAALAGLTLGLSACAAQAPATDLPAGELPEKITIAWIPKALNNPVFDLGRKAAVQRAAELSASGPVKVEVIYAGSVGSDAAEQMRVMEDMIGRGVDAIAISCNDPVACVDPINHAVASGIPVMTWDSNSPKSDRFAYLGLNNYAAGQSAGKLLVKDMGTSGKIALLTGVPGAQNLEERIRGFKDEIKNYPDIKIITTVLTNDDINLGVQMVEETMQAHPDLNGWFFVGMWPLMAGRGSMPLWESATLNRGLKTVTFDTMPEELQLLHDGYLSGLIDQKNWVWGYDTVQILYDRILNKKQYEPFIDSGFNVITINNVDAMMKLIETGDFTKPLPPP